MLVSTAHVLSLLSAFFCFFLMTALWPLSAGIAMGASRAALVATTTTTARPTPGWRPTSLLSPLVPPTTALSVANLLPLSMLRIFTRRALDILLTLTRRPPSGTPFDFTGKHLQTFSEPSPTEPSIRRRHVHLASRPQTQPLQLAIVPPPTQSSSQSKFCERSSWQCRYSCSAWSLPTFSLSFRNTSPFLMASLQICLSMILGRAFHFVFRCSHGQGASIRIC